MSLWCEIDRLCDKPFYNLAAQSHVVTCPYDDKEVELVALELKAGFPFLAERL